MLTPTADSVEKLKEKMREFCEGLWSIEWNSIRPERTFGPFLKMHVLVVDHWILWWEIPVGSSVWWETFKPSNTHS